MADDHVSREALKSRQLPEMTLSTADNPLTAPILPPSNLSAVQRAQYRFQVTGNAIITGGTGTLALTAARALLEHGCAGLALWDISPDDALPVIGQLHASFPHVRITTCTVDVRSPVEIGIAMEDTVKVLGPVSHLLCFAGVVGCAPALEMKVEDWRRTHDINLTGSFLCAQEFAKHVIAQPVATRTRGSIVFTASISAHAINFPQPQVAYNSSKTAILSLAKSLAAEWSVHGIRVNSISPGYMDTVLNEGDGLGKARSIWAERNPMGRMGDPWELTGPLVLLCSNGGRYINGADLIVDGGAMVF
ncbi:2-deoxy-D-gluconate 3-dehydrogenase [Pleomassaria siparia CBS 279.74]|uniref:2-deoxy-D-gluconate 3-dehydrogenase n=1 Tax=Pleomassaria siparia CBS 279.74 TaxID=1314801 RepID=A0A6G1K0Z8_9PLEO|nr:2-deoxy-D-gluconate 3-dehydrogenase [Pleomassaria siparia CBS 279.74]